MSACGSDFRDWCLQVLNLKYGCDKNKKVRR